MALWHELQDFLGDRYVMVIEPRMHCRATIQNFLGQLKCKHAIFAANADEARQIARTRKIGIFISEWQLDGKNGLELCRELRRDTRYRNTPFLLTTLENFKSDIVLASEGGISGYLLKPFSFQDFCDQMRIICSQGKNPDQLQSLLDRAESYFERKEFWIAEAMFREALTIKPQSARAICGLGKIELVNNNQEQALMCFKQAVANNPDYIDGYRQLLKLSQEKNDHFGIIEGAKILHRLSPENPRYPLMIAASHMELGKYVAAEEFFKLTLKLSPTLAAAYRGLGNLYLKTKEFQKAAVNLEKALDLEQSDVATLNSLGLAYVRQNLIDQGIQRYKLALSVNPNDPRVFFNLGLAFELKGESGKAYEAFHQAYQLDPCFEKAFRKFTQIKQKMENTRFAHKLDKPA